MRLISFLIFLAISVSAVADRDRRNIAGKLTTSAKPPVKMMSSAEISAAKENLLVLDLDVDPGEIVCKKVRVGRDSASRLRVTRCKSRAEFREEAERTRLAMDSLVDQSKWKQAFRLNGGLQNHRRKVTTK